MSAEASDRTRCTVTCLGTGDGWPSGERNHSSHVYDFGNTCLLIDCGDGVCRSLTARKFDWDRIDAIFISHTHSDHFGGLFMLLQGMWLDGRSRDLNLFLPRHIIKPLQEMLKHVYLFNELLGFRLQMIPLDAAKPVTVGRVRVRVVANTHLSGLQRSFQKRYKLPFESYSFVLTGAGRRVVHSADLGSPSDLAPLLRRPCDLLLCEFAHFTPTDLIAELSGQAIEKLALIHVSRAHRRRLATIKKLFKRELPGLATTFPDDGDRIRF